VQGLLSVAAAHSPQRQPINALQDVFDARKGFAIGRSAHELEFSDAKIFIVAIEKLNLNFCRKLPPRVQASGQTDTWR
jgi:hypothetical protein